MTAADVAWQQICQELDGSDPHWRWDDLVARLPQLPLEMDAQTLLRDALTWIPAGWPDWQAEVKVTPYGARVTGGEMDQQLLGPPVNYRLDPALRLPLAVALAPVNEVIALTADLPRRESGSRDAGTSPLLFNLVFEHQSRCRAVVGVLQYQAVLANDDGDPAAALDYATRVLAVARCTMDPPTLMTLLVSLACRRQAGRMVEMTLNRHTPDDAALRAIQDAFAAYDRLPLLPAAIRGERAYYADTVAAVEAGLTTPKAIAKFLRNSPFYPDYTGISFIDRWLNRGLDFFTGVFSKDAAAAMVRHHTAAITLASDPRLWAGSPEWKALRRSFLWRTRRKLSGFDKVLRAEFIGRAFAASVQTALALERFRLSHGRWPTLLADLVPRYLHEVPVDPFDGQSLKYLFDTDGVVVYSVGVDGVDSHGKLLNDPNVLIGDIGLEVVSPELRNITA